MPALPLGGGRLGLLAGLHAGIPLADVSEIQNGYDAAPRVSLAPAVDDGALAAAQLRGAPVHVAAETGALVDQIQLSTERALHFADGMILHADAPSPDGIKTLCTILVSA
jgi:hypothetical protein